jgi:hypothetical protein
MVSVVQNVAIDCADGWAILADPEGNEFCVLRSDSDRAAMNSSDQLEPGTVRPQAGGDDQWQA